MRGLPDQPGDKEYPREEWIDQGRPPAKDKQKKEDGKDDLGAGLDDQSGDYVVSVVLVDLASELC